MASTVRTARLTGLSYLGLVVTGVAGFMLIRSQIFVEGDGAATLANLTASEGLARLGVVMELGIALTQALTALMFYRLFRGVSSLAAGAIAAFGMVNAVVILASSALLATAVGVAGGRSGALGGDAAAAVQLLYATSEGLWAACGLFFGLWLIPMGWLVLRSRWMPAALGWMLIAGGSGYVLSTASGLLLPGHSVIGTILTLPAAAGEFWILGYLLVKGVRSGTGTRAQVATVA
ncbi:DUF4386 domain-containing protein [Pseudactinotalea sp. Z1739]|uniref:DUF4386 domain-containing protein n=1 Tax=Pseudactinotalea sp. Z1739 TaxID=3413028 RepID=UPI003C798D7C